MIRDRKLIRKVVDIKRGIVAEIRIDVELNGWSQQDLCREVGLHQPEASEILNCQRLERFSVDRLLMILMKMGHSPTVMVC